MVGYPWPACQAAFSSGLSAISEAVRPATTDHNADVIPTKANGVAATAKATNAPKRQFTPNAFSKASWREEKMASPARANT